MTQAIIIIFGSAALLSALATPLVLGAWRRFGPLNVGGSPHSDGPPRLGGLAIATALILPLAVHRDLLGLSPAALGGLLGTTLAILALGVWDDLRALSAVTKLTAQVAVAAATWAIGFRIEHLTLPGMGAMALDRPTSALLTVAWITVITNAVNLIDGLDGLAAGVSLIAVTTLLALGLGDGQPLLFVAGAALAGALVGFLVWNFNPAVIFMGDSGSLLLGYVLSVVSVASTSKQYTAWALLPISLALGLPLLDTGLAIARRALGGRSILAPDTDHVHHRLLRAGYTHRGAVLWLYGAASLLGLLAWTLAREPSQALIVALAGGGSLSLVHLGVRRGRLPRPTRATQQAQLRAIRDSDTLERLWEHLSSALLTLGAFGAALDLETTPARRLAWRTPGRFRRPLHSVLPLSGDRHRYGRLVIERPRTHSPALERDREIGIHLVAQATQDALDRLAPAGDLRFVVTRLHPGRHARRP